MDLHGRGAGIALIGLAWLGWFLGYFFFIVFFFHNAPPYAFLTIRNFIPKTTLSNLLQRTRTDIFSQEALKINGLLVIQWEGENGA